MSLTTDPENPDLSRILPGGQQAAYRVLSEEEIKKGFVRPVRRSYRHITCGTVTNMALPICETYARNPKFYGGTFCCGCGSHFDLVKDGIRQFLWTEDDAGVGE